MLGATGPWQPGPAFSRFWRRTTRSIVGSSRIAAVAVGSASASFCKCRPPVRACSGSGLRIVYGIVLVTPTKRVVNTTAPTAILVCVYGGDYAQACYSFMGGRSARIEKAKHIAGPDSERPVFSPEMCVYGLKRFAGGGDRPPQHVCSLLEHAHARTVVCRCVVLALRQEEIRIIVKTERRTCSPTRQSTAAPSAFFLPLEPEALGVGFTLVPQIQPAGLS